MADYKTENTVKEVKEYHIKVSDVWYRVSACTIPTAKLLELG